MNLNNLFFHIHYCNYRNSGETGKYKSKITRTLQHHELIFIGGGKGSIAVEKKKYQIKEGMLLYICPDIPYFVDIEAEEHTHFLSVHFSYTGVSFDDGRWAVRSGVKALPLPFAQELKDYYHIADIFKKLVDTWNGKLPGYEFISRTLLQQLLIAIFQNTRKQDQNYSISTKVEKIIKHMHENIDGKVTLTELSKLVQLSPAYLSRAFKEATGYSVIEFFNRMKIDKAKELIIDGDKKVKQVAQALGYADEFYFSRLFKKIEGMSPSEYYSKNVHGV